MASAQTEPSMDEILASIRRIISEEDESPAEVPVRQKLAPLQLRDGADEAEDDGAEDAGAADAEAGEPAAQLHEEAPSDAAAEDGPDALDDFGPQEEPAPEGQASMEPAAEAHDHGRPVDDTFDTGPDEAAPAEPAPQAAYDEPPHAAAPTQQENRIADRQRIEREARAGLSDRSASQAAAAFGTLEDNMRLSSGSGRTIEDLIEGMLTPLLTAWLDENLPRIVEEKVEEEIRRIARRR